VREFTVITPTGDAHQVAAAEPLEAVRSLARVLGVGGKIVTPRRGQADFPRWSVRLRGREAPHWIFVTLPGEVA
jgi:hypothetical protein